MFACPQCGSPVERRHPNGPPPLWCSESCRQKSIRRRRREALDAVAEQIRRTVALEERLVEALEPSP